MSTSIARLANASGRKSGAQQNKGTTKKKANKSAAVKAAAAKPAFRATLGPAAVSKIEANTRKALMADLKSKGRLVEANKKTTKKKGKKHHKKNPDDVSLFGLPVLRNPGFEGVVATAKAAGFGLLGIGASKILAAILLAVGDKFFPTWTAAKYASPIVSFLASIAVLPLVAGMRIFGLAQTTVQWMVAGGALGAAGEAFAIAAGKDIFGSAAQSVRAETAKLLPFGTSTAATPANGQTASTQTTYQPMSRSVAAGPASRWY